MPIDVNPRNTTRGRPRAAGNFQCARCHRHAGKYRTSWPEGRICGTCFHHAMRTYGTCDQCQDERLLPGLDDSRSPICAPCARIPVIRCLLCSTEAEHYRSNICAPCALNADLHALLVEQAADPAAMTRLARTLAAGHRTESVLSWMRPKPVQTLLARIASGEIPLTHAGLDAEPRSSRVEHLRSILEDAKLLERRDHHLALFERWLKEKLSAVEDQDIRQPLERFARWHHLARMRAKSTPGTESRGPAHSAKQEITETLKFLTWLQETHGRHAMTCTQLDVNEYLSDGPTTRSSIRNYFQWLSKTGAKRDVVVPHRQAKSQPKLTQDQRLAWIREMLDGQSESLPYRTAGMLLLLYAQPIVRLVTLKTSDLRMTPGGPAICFATDTVPIPHPFSGLLYAHFQSLPKQGGEHADWLFPSTRRGRHIHANTVMDRLRSLGIDLLGARNRALADLVSEVPPPVVAIMLGYSSQVTHRHSAAAAVPMARYAALSRR